MNLLASTNLANLGFISPQLALGLVALVPLIAWLILRERVLKKDRALLGIKTEARWFAIAIPVLIVTLLIFALARPYNGFEDIEITAAGLDIVAVVDVSQSMRASDVSPSRMQLASRTLLDLTSLVERANNGDRIGIVLFAGESYLYSPLTSDYAVLRLFIDSISPDLVTSPGSQLTSALQTAIQSLQATAANRSAILLLSDGEDDRLDLNEAVSLMNKAGLPARVLGFGTPKGASIQQRDGSYMRDDSGQLVVSTLHEESLKSLAEQTGGIYHRGSAGDAALRAVMGDLLDTTASFEKLGKGTRNTSEANTRASRIRMYNEFGPGLVAIALGLLLLYIGWQRGAMLGIALLYGAVFGGGTQAFAQELQESSEAVESTPDQISSNQAWRLYQEGDFAGAERGFQELVAQNSKDLAAREALGGALYKQKKYAEAQKAYTTALGLATLGRDQFRLNYNLGNTAANRGKFDEAISHYEKALAIKPGDPESLHNLETIKKLREQITPTPTPTPSAVPTTPTPGTPSPEPSPSASPSESPGPEGTPSPNPTSGTPSGTQTPGETPNSQTPQPSSEGSPTAAPTAQQTAEYTPAPGATAEPMSAEELKEEEARAWLDSLADAPLLLRRKVGDPRSRGGQRW